MTATIAPTPPPTKESKSTTRRSSHKPDRRTRGRKRERARRPVAPVQWRTLPFAGFIAALLVVGMMTLLVVNNSLAAGSFERARLKADRTLLFEQEQALNQSVLALSSPRMLRREARRLGMVPAASPAFLDVSSGRILGVPKITGPGAPATDSPGADTEPVELPDSATPGESNSTTSDSSLENPTELNDVAREDAQVPGGSEDQAPATNPPVAGDGAQISSGTAQDRAIVSGSE